MVNSHNTDNSNKAATRDRLRLHHPRMDSSSNSRHPIAPRRTAQLPTAPRPTNRVLDTLHRDLADMFVSHARDYWRKHGSDRVLTRFLSQGAPQSYPGGPPPQGQQQQQQQQQQQYPPQGQQYGGPPQQGQGQFAGGPPPPSSGPQDIGQYTRQLEEAIQQKRLQSFYPPGDPRIQQTAQRAAQQVDKLVAAWHIPREIAVDIVR